MRFFTQTIIFIITVFFFIGNTFAAINMTVSPIKYEINVDPGDVIVRSATLFNYSDQTLNITTSQAEFKADGDTGQPTIVAYNPEDDTVGSWITIFTEGFSIEPNEKKTISFDVVIPDNARPGGHYAAVFFKNNNTSNGVGSSIGVNVDYGVLLLINVSGEIIVEGNVEEEGIIIKNSGGSGWGGSYSRKKDDCPLGDFSKSNFDNICFDNILGTNDGINDTNIDEEVTFESLDVSFKVPFKNNGNTHIKPTGKITLKDENNRQIKGIGKQVILNDNGAIIGEKIVDFIPINDIGGNVLPQTKRIFEGEWKGFPYKTYDDEGNEIVKYWSPNEYYSNKNIPDNLVLNFWERILERSNKKKVTADIQVTYTDLNGEEIEFNSAEEFYIEYVDTYVGMNKYIIFIASLLGLFSIFFVYMGYRKKKNCNNCNKKIHKIMKICPYCGKKQKNMKEKLQDIKEKITKKSTDKKKKNKGKKSDQKKKTEDKKKK